MPHVATGDLLKSEADPNSRIAIDAPTGTMAGQPVLHPTRNEYLIALSDEVHGKVLVQPHNCVMYLHHVDMDAITAVQVETPDPNDASAPAIMTGLTIDTLIEQGDAHGIKYINSDG